MAALPETLEKAIHDLEELFWVDQATLKNITKRFVEELEEGEDLLLSDFRMLLFKIIYVAVHMHIT
jgi:hexokinase